MYFRNTIDISLIHLIFETKIRNQLTQHFVCCEEKSLILICECYPYQILFQIFSLLSYTRKNFIWSLTEKYLEISCFQKNEMPATFLNAFKIHWSYWKSRRTTKTNSVCMEYIFILLFTANHWRVRNHYSVVSFYSEKDYISLSDHAVLQDSRLGGLFHGMTP